MLLLWCCVLAYISSGWAESHLPDCKANQTFIYCVLTTAQTCCICPKHPANEPLGMVQKECAVAMVLNSAFGCWLGTWCRACCTPPPLPCHVLFQAVHIVLVFPEAGLMAKFQSKGFDLEIFGNIWKSL